MQGGSAARGSAILGTQCLQNLTDLFCGQGQTDNLPSRWLFWGVDQSIEIFVHVGYGEGPLSGMYWASSKVPASRVCLSNESAFLAPYEASSSGAAEDQEIDMCVVWWFTWPTPSQKGRWKAG